MITTLPGAATDAASDRILGAAAMERLLAAHADLSPSSPALEPTLRAVLDDTLAHPGSLLRAQVAYDIQRRHGVGDELALPLAVALEYFHSASLLFDDLPSMDDGRRRRGRTCPHLVHGEAATQLAALALITRGYALLWRVLGTLPPERSMAAADLVAECLGAAGILDGQSRDLHGARGGAWHAADVERVAEGKTVTLIRLCLVLPALVAGAGPPGGGDQTVATLEELAVAWGLAYQILDDFKDHLLTADESGKTPRRDAVQGRPNLPRAAGADAALLRVTSLLADADRCVAALERAAGDEAPAAESRWHGLRALHTILEGECADTASRLGVLEAA